MTANGKLDVETQTVAFYGVRLAPIAASDGGRMVNAAARVGHVIRPLVVKDQASGYRSEAVQTAMRWAQANGHASDYDLLPSPPAPPLAPVGYSRHGQARACDWVWSSPAALTWLVAHSGEYGWTFWDRATDEPHMEHDAAHSVVTWTEPGLAPAGAGSTVFDNNNQEDDMSTPTAKDNTQTGSAKFGYIAVAVNGQLHEIAPDNRGFWITLQAIYPGLTAADVDQLGYATFVAANSPTDVSASIAALTPAITAAVTAAVKANPAADAAAIATAVDTALADNFALLPKQVVQAEGAALANG